MDLAKTNAAYAQLSYVHPAFVVVALGLAFFVFSRGLKQRDQRVRRVPAPKGNLKLHLGLGPWAVSLVGVGALLGVASAALLRGWRPLGTAHGWIGLGATLAFAAVWWLGRAIVKRKRPLAVAHGLVGLLAVALGGLAALTGIALLP